MFSFNLNQHNALKDPNKAFYVNRRRDTKTGSKIRFNEQIVLGTDWAIEMRVYIPSYTLTGSDPVSTQALLLYLLGDISPFRFIFQPNRAFFVFKDTAPSDNNFAETNTTRQGVWSHWIFSMENGVAFTQYGNGVQRTNFVTPPVDTRCPTFGGSIFNGGIGYGDGANAREPQGFFKGLRIWKQSISSSEASDLYANIPDKMIGMSDALENNLVLDWDLSNASGQYVTNKVNGNRKSGIITHNAFPAGEGNCWTSQP